MCSAAGRSPPRGPRGLACPGPTIPQEAPGAPLLLPPPLQRPVLLPCQQLAALCLLELPGANQPLLKPARQQWSLFR